ncbi:unnamed protein product [Adineta ricciae]|uniref:SCP domain-containing protein n=1 Tax=Adineta ricciae TaxID=249248 RepID=A0A814L3S2_ADIRI|nr:unnamed protein product [Adineta ricciae]
MDIQTFSQTYWYIWFIIVLFIVSLVLINGVGVYLYRKKRRKFLQQTNRIDNEIPMRTSLNSTSFKLSNPSYGSMSTLSIGKRPSGYNNSKVHPSRDVKISTIHETMRSDQSDSSFSSSDEPQLSLEEFQRQALEEHNNIRTIHNKPLMKLDQSLNLYAQYWAEQCARTNVVKPSKLDWRMHCKGELLDESLVSINSTEILDGSRFTYLLMSKGNQSHEVDCILTELSTEVGFGRAKSHPNDQTQTSQWIGVAHYYPCRQLTTVQS